ncbi:putative transposase [Actimicrobium sp. GrIS 1.19]|nr:putative transposase [Actimicrobium sp. GrIS 1.19]
MIDRTHDLPVVKQCKILSLSRSTAYYKPHETSQNDLALMRRIDELHLDYPFAGSRMLRDLLHRDGFPVGRKHVATLMKKMRIVALYKKPNTSRRHPAHLVYPYLLRHMEITRPNHVFAADITYIPMKRGFVYLFAVMDWASRRVLAWRLSNTLTTDFCLEAVQEAIDRNGAPEIFNTDQGSQFTSFEFTQLLKDNHIAISMDGRGCWRDNVFVERLWKSIKYEEVYLRSYDTVSQARDGIGQYLNFYNARRPHSSLDAMTPDEYYYQHLPALQQAA